MLTTGNPAALRGNAVVIGSSMSGMLAARAMANHFAQVTVIERDSFPPAGNPRKGVPQGKHAHLLLSHGQEVIESFFPGLSADLIAQGGIAVDLTETGRWFSNNHYTIRYKSGLVTLQISRPLLEARLRSRLRALPNVTILENCDVSGLTTTPDRDCITGVQLVHRGVENPHEETLSADLVVDASGRGSRSPAWLEGLGYARAPEEYIKMNLTYTTRVYRRLPEHLNGDNTAVVLLSHNTKRTGVLLGVEGGHWIVTLSGLLGDSAPLDEAGFLEFARTLDAPDIYEVIKVAEPLSEPVQYKYPSSQRRHYEKLTRFPAHFLIFGDAICSFNPIYGQGMTVAASEAVLLDEVLAGPSEGLAQRFFRRASHILDTPWAIAAGSDLLIPEIEGKRTLLMQLSNRYIARLNRAGLQDKVLSLAFQKVANLMTPPSSLFQPGIMLRVLWGNLKMRG